MKTNKLPYGHPSTLRQGPFECKGSIEFAGAPMNNTMTAEQKAWMKANKPAYYTGKAMSDIPHLPAHLRCA